MRLSEVSKGSLFRFTLRVHCADRVSVQRDWEQFHICYINWIPDSEEEGEVVVPLYKRRDKGTARSPGPALHSSPQLHDREWHSNGENAR